MRRSHAVLAAAVLAAAVWAYFVAHPLGGTAPGEGSAVPVWDVPVRSVTALVYQDGPFRVALEPRWEGKAEEPYIWIRSDLTVQAPPPPPARGKAARKPPPPPAAPRVDSAAFKGNAAAEQTLAAFAGLKAVRDLGPLAALDAKQFGFPAKDASLELQRGGSPALKLELGRHTFGDTGRYVHDPANDHLYLLSDLALRRLLTVRGTLMDRDLLGIRAEQAQRIELSAGGITRTFYRLAREGQWAPKADAAQGDPNAAVVVKALNGLPVLRYRGEDQLKPAGPPALEAKVFLAGSDQLAGWLRIYGGSGESVPAESSYTQHPVELAGPLVRQVLEKARAALHGT
jgi:Domain of unknown function (DUF4340)